MQNRLYDIHYHAFDLSHANLLAFLSREDIITSEGIRNLYGKIPGLLRWVPLGLAKVLFEKFFRQSIFDKAAGFIRDTLANNKDALKIKSLLAIMENAVEFHFLYIEYFLKNRAPYFGDPVKYSYSEQYPLSRIVICPLIMDFGYKNIKSLNGYYNIPPNKPVVNQIIDLLNAIYFYFHYRFETNPARQNKLRLTEVPGKENKLFEIYPFMGINTRNMDILQVKRVFEKYFRNFGPDSPVSRYRRLKDKMGELLIDVEDFYSKKEDNGQDLQDIFAGIKLYPPLGFNPWPENDLAELEKVKLLYQTCIEKRIPIIVHCSDGGFITDPEGRDFADPSKGWRKVLSNYKDLLIDFAHFGSQISGSTQWKKTILEYFSLCPNVYSDISCCGMKPEFYPSFRPYINTGTVDRFLFGSDFMINLIWSESYNQYLDTFITTKGLDMLQKKQMSQINPERFLFG